MTIESTTFFFIGVIVWVVGVLYAFSFYILLNFVIFVRIVQIVELLSTHCTVFCLSYQCFIAFSSFIPICYSIELMSIPSQTNAINNTQE